MLDRHRKLMLTEKFRLNLQTLFNANLHTLPGGDEWKNCIEELQHAMGLS
jgi:hypothetical protein